MNASSPIITAFIIVAGVWIVVLFLLICVTFGKIKILGEKQDEQSDKLFSLQRQIDKFMDTKRG